MTSTPTTESSAPPAARGRRPKRGRASAASPVPLGNTADKVSTPPPELDRDGLRRANRDQAYRLRRRLWDLSSLTRVRSCGRVSHTGAGGPTLRISGGAAGYAGLVSCGSVWSCPCCARKIGAQRAAEITQVVSGVFAEGGGAALITLTLRHHAGHRLTQSWDALRHGWRRVISGRAYQRECGRFGVLGWAAVLECTVGESGWHPHLHVLVLTESPVSVELVEALGARWFARWERAIGRRGFTALADRGGLDARVVATADGSSGVLGHYLSKLAAEVCGGPSKRGRRGSRTPFQVLADGLATGVVDDLELWWEWEAASHNRRQLTWAKGVRDRYGLAPERSDEEVAADGLDSPDVIALPAATWAHVREVAEDLLTVAELGGLNAVTTWLAVRRLDWVRLPPRPERTALPPQQQQQAWRTP